MPTLLQEWYNQVQVDTSSTARADLADLQQTLESYNRRCKDLAFKSQKVRKDKEREDAVPLMKLRDTSMAMNKGVQQMRLERFPKRKGRM